MRDTLKTQLEAHLAKARRLAERAAWVDVGSAEQIAGVLTSLLADWDALAEHHHAIQRAVEAFVDEDDEEPDFDSPVGFDDDVEVLNRVLAHIGRDDLRIEL